VLEDTFYYELANTQCGILEKGVRVIYKNRDKKYMLHSLSNSYEEEAPNCELKYLLISRERRFNLLDEIVEKTEDLRSVFVKKVQKLEDGWVIKLSNKMV
jgi:hypothetical protein